MYFRLFRKSLILTFRHQFEVIHAIRSLPEGLVGLAISRITSVPLVVYNHGEELTTWGHGIKYKVMCFTIRHAGKVVANSDYTRDQLLRIGIDPEKITTIYPGVDVQRFQPGLKCDDLKKSLGLDNDQTLVLSVGRLSRRKGFDMVIRSLPLLVNKGCDVHYALVGIGDDQEYLSER